MDNDSIDTFDHLFEPFDPEEGGEPPEPTAAEAPPVTGDTTPSGGEPAPSMVICVSCGSDNDAANRHCERCGARLVRSQMPVAPQPIPRTTAGARALFVLAMVVLGVAVLALVFNVFGGETAATETTTTTEPTVVTSPVKQLEPIRIECTSELPAFPCTALIDGDSTTSWNATDGGIGVQITFLFSPPVQITEMMIRNLTDEGRFLRNARMKGIEVLIDDLQQIQPFELRDTNDEPQRFRIQSLRTSSLTIRINSHYPGQSHEGREPFPELAAQEIAFFGRIVD